MADKDLGAWDSERVALEQTPLSGRGNDVDAPNTVRFCRSVAQLVVRRERETDADYDRPAAFVLTPRERFEHLPSSTHRQPLLATGHYRLTGQIHFVNVVANGHSLDYTGDSVELFSKLEAIDAQSLPTLVYSPKKGSSTLSWYPNGINDENSTELWNVAEEQPTPERITEVISLAHKHELITPDQTPIDAGVWQNAGRGWAHKHAEARVQRTVRLTLLGAFRHCSVRAEQPGKDGRTDLEIVEDHDRPSDQIVHHAVLELKVLREKGSTGNKYTDAEIAKHMRDGLEQAHSYGNGRSFRERMLCCFDMRATDAGAEAVLSPLRGDATKLGVHLRHWFLYRSSEHWRKCTITKQLTNGKTPPSLH